MQIYELEVAPHPEISEEDKTLLWPYSVKTERASVKGVIVLPYVKETLIVAMKSVMEQLNAMFPPPEGIDLCPWLKEPPPPPVAVNWPAVIEEKVEKKKTPKPKKPAPEPEPAPVETSENPFSEIEESEADHDSGRRLRADEILYIKGDPKQKEDCLKLIERLTGVSRSEIPRYPEIGGAASRCLIAMVSDEMIFYREGAVSEEVTELFTQNIPNVRGA